MADLKSPTDPPENSCSTLSQEDIRKPLSPVLGTGQSLKKILRNRKERHKRGPNRIVQELQNIMKPKGETDKNSISINLKSNSKLKDLLQNIEGSISDINAIPGPSKSGLNLKDMPENLIERIHVLEEIDTKKSNIIKALSFSKSVYVDTLQLETDSGKPEDGLHEIIEKDQKIFEELLFPNHVTEKTGDVLQEKNMNVCFQTGSGKSINISEDDIKKSSKLFDDLLFPSNNQPFRNKKFRYLSKYGSPEKHVVSEIPVDTTGCVGKYGTTAMVSQSAKIWTSKQPFKNILEGESGDDSMLVQESDFKTTSISVKVEEDNTFSKAEHQEKSLQQQIKHIFKGENFYDLKLLKNSGFNAASVILKEGQFNKKLETEPQERPQQKLVKNIFEEENFENLKEPYNSGTNAALINIRNDIIGEKSETKILQGGPLKISIRNIFEGENFDDLKLPQMNGFKAASIGLKNEQLNRIPEQKLLKSTFKGNNCDDLEVLCNNGFQQAVVSLKYGEGLREPLEEVINPSTSSATKPLKNIFENENFSDLNFTENFGFKPASLSLKDAQNHTKTDTKVVEVFSKGTYKNVLGLDNSNRQTTKIQGLKRAIAPEKHIQEPLSKKPFKNIFDGENFEDLNLKFGDFQGFKYGPSHSKTASSTVPRLENKPKIFKNIFEGENFDDLNLVGLNFQTPLTKRNVLKSRNFESPYITPIKSNIGETINDQSDYNFYGFSDEEKEGALNISDNNFDIVNIIKDRFKAIISEKNHNKPLINLYDIDRLCKKLYNNKQKYKLKCDVTIGNRYLDKKRKFSEVDSDHNSLCQNTLSEKKISEENVKNSNQGTPLQRSLLKGPKKRLGCHFSPTIHISETVLKKAKLMFEDLEYKPIETSTPIKLDRSLATPLSCDLTPVPGARKNLGNSFLHARKFNKTITLDQTLIKSNGRFSLNKPSEGNVNDWLETLNSERRLLEEKLRTVDERQTILANQKTMLEFSARGKKRILPGVLYKAKSRENRISLKDLKVTLQPEENFMYNNFLNEVNPQNAHLVHFYMENIRQPHIRTQDGAVIVPSLESRIGFSEIEHSFKVMETVDPNLIPKGWIQNHYKWIIWKLASYERKFLDQFEGCLCIENVIQQLKYRYDIEIDRVKRSVLHKIFEKDDCPQRRLVLCVSQIIKVNNTYELELTDGWYSVRTVIDPPLCDQIIKGKIKLGIKLMTYGADLMNCEGCHPLEATDLIYLKINYNSTRRAAWWSKLGYQKNSGPFLIPISSINMEGGKIGCITCFILRVYPVKYVEKSGNKNVWRNQRAEERRQQEFYNEKITVLEKTNNSVYNGHCKDVMNIKESNRDILKYIQNEDDPETLYNILQKSNDPEYIQEILSSTQKTLIYNYTMNKSAQDQSKLMNTFNEKARMLQERSVSSLLKIKIIDAHSESNEIYDFHVWKPQESYIQELREGEVITIFNACCSSKWGLSANRTTQFKKELRPTDERFQNLRRKVTPIGELPYFSKKKEILMEFDTVGIVVKKRVGDHQQVWLTDSKEKSFIYIFSLLVIKIYDSPKNVLVLDAVNEGQIVTVCNLVFKHSSEEHSFAVADHFVVFSRYSQFRHLQEVAEDLEKELANVDLIDLLQICTDKVDKIEMKWDSRNSKVSWDIDDMDCSQITTTDLALLECVDKLT